MREQDIKSVDILLTRLYQTVDYVDFNEQFMKDNKIPLLKGDSFTRFTRLISTTGFVIVPTIQTDVCYRCALAEKGLYMMMTYGCFRNYLEDIQAKRLSDKLMYRFTVIVAISTIVSCLLNVGVVLFK